MYESFQSLFLDAGLIFNITLIVFGFLFRVGQILSIIIKFICSFYKYVIVTIQVICEKYRF
jgi:Na+/alanine symporter